MRRERWILGKTLTLVFLPLLFGCREDRSHPVGIKFDPQLVVVPEVVCLMAGEALQLSAFFEDDHGIFVPLPPGDAVSWESSNPAVAQVTKDGRVLALAEGEANITAGCRGYRATSMVRVSDPCGGRT